MIHKNIVVLANEKGYDRFHPYHEENFKIKEETWYLELCLLQEWLRTKKDILVELHADRTTEPKFCFNVYKYSHFGHYEDIINDEWYLYKSPVEALEDGIVVALKNI